MMYLRYRQRRLDWIGIEDVLNLMKVSRFSEICPLYANIDGVACLLLKCVE